MNGPGDSQVRSYSDDYCVKQKSNSDIFNVAWQQRHFFLVDDEAHKDSGLLAQNPSFAYFLSVTATE